MGKPTFCICKNKDTEQVTVKLVLFVVTAAGVVPCGSP